MLHHPLEFNADAMRRLVTVDPFLAYTIVHHAGESEEHWLRLVFALEVMSDPGLSARYRVLAALHDQPHAA